MIGSRFQKVLLLGGFLFLGSSLAQAQICSNGLSSWWQTRDTSGSVHQIACVDPLNGAVYFQNLRGTSSAFDASGFPGADMCAKIAAAYAVSTAGSIIDARGFSGAQNCAAAPFPNQLTPITLLTSPGLTITSSVGWVFPRSSAWMGGGGFGTAGNSAYQETTTNLNCTITTGSCLTVVAFSKITNLVVNSTGTGANGIEIQQTNNSISHIQATAVSGSALWLHGNNPSNFCSFNSVRDSRFYSTNAPACLVKTDSGAPETNVNTFDNIQCNNTAGTQASTVVDNSTNNTFIDLYSPIYTTGQAGIDVSSPSGVSGNNVFISPYVEGTPSGYSVLTPLNTISSPASYTNTWINTQFVNGGSVTQSGHLQLPILQLTSPTEIQFNLNPA